MAKEIQKNKIFINVNPATGGARATLRYLRTVQVGGKTIIKGAIDTKRKGKGDVWETARAQFTCWQSNLRTADGEGFADVEISDNTSYDVELVGLAVTATAYLDKDGNAQANQSADVGLKPTVVKTYTFDGASASNETPAPAGNSNEEEDDIPF